MMQIMILDVSLAFPVTSQLTAKSDEDGQKPAQHVHSTAFSCGIPCVTTQRKA